jgi:hypothetical protein
MKRAVAAISLANLFFLDEWDRVASRWSDAVLASPPNPTLAQFFGPVLLAILVVTGVFLCLPSRLWKWFAPIALFAPLNLFRINVLHFEHTTAIAFLAICAVAVLWWREKALTIPLLLAPLLPIQFAYNLWRYEYLPPPSAYVDEPHRQLFPEPTARRLIWIIFDELDQSLVFDHRPASVELPEFDRLRRESLYAERIEARGRYTQEAIPSLLSGNLVQHASPLGPGDLLLTRSHETTRWSFDRNIFDALSYEYHAVNSALLGSELPYCRAIGGSLASCDWFPSGTVEVALKRPTILGRAWYLLRTRPFTFPGLSSTRFYRAPLFDEETRRESRQAEAASFEKMRRRALELAADTRFQLVYMHFPIPHLLGFYDRRTQEYSTKDSSSYLDNLALADRTLGEIRAVLPANTMLLVTSDHPLRNWIIEDAGWWNDPETASLGTIPRRYVPLLVRCGSSTFACRVETRINTDVYSLVINLFSAPHI